MTILYKKNTSTNNYISKRSHCYSRLSDEFFNAQMNKPRTSSNKLVFKYDFDQSDFDLTMFQNNRVRNRISKNELEKLIKYLKNSVTNYDIKSIDQRFKKVF